MCCQNTTLHRRAASPKGQLLLSRRWWETCLTWWFTAPHGAAPSDARLTMMQGDKGGTEILRLTSLGGLALVWAGGLLGATSDFVQTPTVWFVMRKSTEFPGNGTHPSDLLEAVEASLDRRVSVQGHVSTNRPRLCDHHLQVHRWLTILKRSPILRQNDIQSKSSKCIGSYCINPEMH